MRTVEVSTHRIKTYDWLSGIARKSNLEENKGSETPVFGKGTCRRVMNKRRHLPDLDTNKG